MKPDNTIATVLVNSKKTVPCPEVSESAKVMGTPFLDIHDVGQVISSSSCEEMTSNDFVVKEEMNLEQLSDVKPENPIETILVNVNGTVPCPGLEKVPESVNVIGSPSLDIHDVGQVMSSGCEKMSSNAFIVKEEMYLKVLSDVKPDNLIETVLVNVNETVPCPKLMKKKSVNDVGTPCIFVGVKKEIPDYFGNEASCGNLGTQHSSEVNCRNHDRECKGVDECLEGSSPMLLRNICNVKVKMEHEQESEIEFDLQTSDVLSMTTDTNCTFDCKSEEEGCDVRHSSEEFIKGMDCLDHPILRMKQERENPDMQIAVNRKNSGFTRKRDTLNSDEEKDLNETCDKDETLQSKDCGTEFNLENNGETRNNPSKGNILSTNVTHPVSDEGKSLEHAEDKNSFSCLICKKCFKRKSDLQRHIPIHSTVKPYSCEVCNARFTLMDYLQSHMRRCHTGDLTCDICQKLFSNKKDLKVHMATHRDERLYSCDFCNKSFSTNFILKMHRLTHTGEKPFLCDICHKTFTTKLSLDLHTRSHTGEKLFTCDTCQKSFTSKQNLKKHSFTHTGEIKPYSCYICEKSYFDKHSLQRHMLTHASKKSFTCDGGEKSFSQEYKLGRNKRTYRGEKTYPCNICSANFSAKGRLRKHEQIHIRGKVFTCDICSKSFSRTFTLKEHLFTHTGERPYTCNICHKSFTYRSSLRIHMPSHTNVKPYSCDICQKSFSTKTYLKNHSVTHSDEKPFSCDICRRSFSLRKFLIAHLGTHSSEKPYTCDICHKSFSLKNNISLHMQSHSNERPYKCDICHKSFRRSRDLGKHKPTHSTEKPYSCNFCSACFSYQGYLQKHEKIHTQPKPVCDICQKSFTEKSSLKQHMLIHTGEKPFSCDICHEAFRYRRDLKYHIQTHTK